MFTSPWSWSQFSGSVRFICVHLILIYNSYKLLCDNQDPQQLRYDSRSRHKKKKKNAAGRTNACLLERDFHKHRSAHQHKEVEEWPSWHDFDEYSCHFSRSSTVRKANSWPGKSPPPTDYQRLHAKCFRHISARTSRVTCDLEIIRKMFFLLSDCSILPSLSPCFSLKLSFSPQSNLFYLPLLLLLFAELNWWYWLFWGWGEQSAVLFQWDGSVPVPQHHSRNQSHAGGFICDPAISWGSVAKSSGRNQAAFAPPGRPKTDVKMGQGTTCNGKNKKKLLSVQT